jgi:predicted ATP-dependent endonuclease of OLD family
MHLKRVRVPNFRVLKDVDITFESNLVPRIFPLGSVNGGGKSTLLQLIFTLLHCCADEQRIPYLQNMLDGFEIEDDSGYRDLATIDLVVDSQDIKLNFFLCDRKYIENNLEGVKQEKTSSTNKIAANFIFTNKRINAVNLLTRKQQNKDCETFLLCKYIIPDNHEKILTKVDLFSNISDNIFLAAPITQIFHFLPKSDRLLLFKNNSISNKSNSINYYHKIDNAKLILPGFFPYNTFSTDFIIEIFESAIDRDIKQISYSNSYGNSYPKLFVEIGNILAGRKVNVDLKTKMITFTKADEGQNPIQLYPEDLSHGELKRMSLCLWLKYNNIDNAIVLMDEVEIALHPDWQYGIINDLQTWAPNNQYILATHSYEMCQALTPAHVKEIEPKLLKQK